VIASPIRHTPPSSEQPAGENGGRRLIIVSNRLPVTLAASGDGAAWKPSAGGLATGLRSVAGDQNTIWVGWPGALDGIDETIASGLLAELEASHTVPVRLSRDEIEVFYEDISNGVLWPIFHDRLDQPPLLTDGWDVYEAVNERFADTVAAIWRPGDLIWIHDYHLMRVPALLRARIPDAQIGFFLHIPFPNPEIFFTLPVRERLVEGLLGADVIGFHTRRYRGHFTAALRRLFGLEMDADAHVRYQGRQIALGVFPMGIDAAGFAERATSRAVSAAVLEVRAGALHERLILGIDRLDYSKGIARRLLSFQCLLERHPEWRERVRFLQLAVPSRGGVRAYRRLRDEVERLVSRINGEFSTPSWTPIRYMHRSVDDTTLLSLYRSADVMLVTPVRDGMNLVAKEFAACRSDEDGVLILSEFAGAADQLVDALIVNPYDIDGVGEAIHRALSMEGSERRRRMRRLREQVLHYDVNRWVAEFVGALTGARR
jgi:trehalose 6-phosphate synthase/phosphatase